MPKKVKRTVQTHSYKMSPNVKHFVWTMLLAAIAAVVVLAISTALHALKGDANLVSLEEFDASYTKICEERGLTAAAQRQAEGKQGKEELYQYKIATEQGDLLLKVQLNDDGKVISANYQWPTGQTDLNAVAQYAPPLFLALDKTLPVEGSGEVIDALQDDKFKKKKDKDDTGDTWEYSRAKLHYLYYTDDSYCALFVSNLAGA